MDSPSVSVVMSVFNGQAFLTEAIESILGQTFRDFEFLVIDDGSTDKTAEILASYAARDDRLHVVRHENRGRTASLNTGIGLAKGKYIARMDADDVALPNRLEQQVAFMERHLRVGLLGGAYEKIDSEGVSLGNVCSPLEDSEIRSVMLHYNPMCHPAVIMRRQMVLDVGGYRRAFSESEDYDLWLRMAERCQLANLEQRILRYRIHPRQVSIANAIHQTLCVLAARSAAELRMRGKADPLSGVDKITPRLLGKLGVATGEIRETLLSAYTHWLSALELNDPEAALRVIDNLLDLAGSGCIDRPTVADAWLKAASIHYRQHRPVEALRSALRGILVRPVVAGRPIKRAVIRLSAALRS
jgi:glycosyltransferase involved in cell wall biosynthesis